MIWLCILATIYVIYYTLKVFCYIAYLDDKKPVYIRLKNYECDDEDDYETDTSDNNDLPASVKHLYS